MILQWIVGSSLSATSGQLMASRKDYAAKENNMFKIPFVETLWSHYRWVGTGKLHVVDQFGSIEEIGRREEHWGRKRTCRKCKRSGKFRSFKNRLTINGILVISAIMLVLLVFILFFLRFMDLI